MELSNEMKKMVSVLEKYDVTFRNNLDYKHYVAPNIPDKILTKLIKYFDSHLAVNSVVAYYDNTLFGTSLGGFIFTNDGVYYKFVGKAIYFSYKDIISMKMEKDDLVISFNNVNFSEYKIADVLNLSVLRNILYELKAIDAEYGQSSHKSIGKVKKIDLPPKMLNACNAIIHSAAVACGGVGTGLAQIPATDNAVMVPIQIGMIISLGTVFKLNISESAAKSIIGSLGASIAGRTVSQFLWGWIPGIGNAINTATAAGLTEAIGWAAVADFYARWLEDKNKGRLEGMKDGYIEASGEYERKLRKQAEEFFNQMKDVKREREEYEKLLNEYEKYIRELEAKCAATEKINEFCDIYKKLKYMDSAS